MNRFTISLDDQLARQFDTLIADKGYANRSEAVRDLIRYGLGRASIGGLGARGEEAICIASVSYVYDHREPAVTARVLGLKHTHHDLVINTQYTPLDHHDCLETVILRGPVPSVRHCADHLTSLRGVRHGNVHLVLLTQAEEEMQTHGHASVHRHLSPVN